MIKCTHRISTKEIYKKNSSIMDDLMLKSKSNLLNLKGKDWSSLHNLDSEDSEETNSEINYHPNGCYLNSLNRMSLVNGSEYTSDDSSLPLKNHDTTKLNKEDMLIYGLRPAYDEFYLVVCEHCKKVFKPQALSRHIELRHSKNEINSDLHDRQVRSEEESSSLTEYDFNSNRMSDNNHNLRSLLSSASSSLLAAHSTKDDLDLEKLKHKQQHQKQSLLSSNLNTSHSTAASPLNIPPSSDCNSVANKQVTKHKLLPLKDRKYDPDKHCGVQVSPNLTPCTRSLTCKTHSLTLRRSVPGRRDSFDNLLNEHRLAKEALLRAAGVEVKPTKLQLRQQQRLQKNNLLKEQQQQKEALKEQTNSNSSSLSNPSNVTPFKIHLQPLNSPSSLTTSPSFKAFNQLHPHQESTSIFNSNISNLNNKPNITAPQSPTTNSYANINKPQFTSPSSTVKQFTFGNNQQIGKLSSPSRQTLSFNQSSTNNLQSTGVLASSIQVINQTNLMNNNYVTNFDSSASKNYTSPPSTDKRSFMCDISPTTINHYPKPAAICTFNERRLSIFTQSSNKQILSSKLFNRKHDYTYSALSVFCNKEKMLNDASEPNEQSIINRTPVKQTKIKQYKNSILSNSQSNSRNEFYSSNSNSQESFQHQTSSPFDRTNGLSSPSLGRKSSVDLVNDHSISKSCLYGYAKSSGSISNDKESDKFNSVHTPMKF